MALVRVQLHNETRYDEFHRAMMKRGYSQLINGSDGVTYQAPRGNWYNPNTTPAQAVEDTRAACAEIKADNPLSIIASDGLVFSLPKAA
jgi:hypothetical protein